MGHLKEAGSHGDSSSTEPIKIPLAVDRFTRPWHTGLPTPPLGSPNQHQPHQSITPPPDDKQECRLPPISELFKLVPSTQPNPALTPLPSPSPRSFTSAQTWRRDSWTGPSQPQNQTQALPPIIPIEVQYPSPPAGHSIHLPLRQTLKRGQDDYGDYRPTKRRRDEHWEGEPQSQPLPRIVPIESRYPGPSANHWTYLPPRKTLKRRRDNEGEGDRGQGFFGPTKSRRNEYLDAQYSQALVPFRRHSDLDTWALTLAHPRGSSTSPECASVSPGGPSGAPGVRKRRSNAQYPQDEEFAIRYFLVDLGYTWSEVHQHFMRWFPKIERTLGALRCEYYRTNKQIPVLEDGLLAFRPPRKEEGEELSKEEYKGIPFVYKENQCRRDKIWTLLQLFPEEYEDPKNRWIRPEDRGKGKEAGRRRKEQRERHLQKVMDEKREELRVREARTYMAKL